MPTTGKDDQFNGAASGDGASKTGLINRKWSRSSSDGGFGLLESTKSSPPDPGDIINDKESVEEENTELAILRVDVRWDRLLIATVIATAVMLTFLILFRGKGRRLDLVSDITNADKQKAKSDDYNAISGFIVAAVLKPIGSALSMLVSVACLSFIPRATLQIGSRPYILTALLGAFVSFLVTNGLNALNVQLVPGDPIQKISLSDLMLSKSTAAVDSMRNKSTTKNEPGNSVLNTILRTHLIDRNNSYEKGMIVSPIWYGFGYRPWHEKTLTTARDSTSYRLEDAYLPLENGLPMSVENASYLALATAVALAWVMYSMSAYSWNVAFLWDGVNDSNSNVISVDEITPSTNSMNDSIRLLHKMLQKSTNISVGNVNVSYESVNLSDSVTFNALTLEIPTKVMNDSTSDDNNFSCSINGCVAIDADDVFSNGFETLQPFVVANAVCENYDADFFDLHSSSSNSIDCGPSNSSMLVVGLGKKLVGHSLDYGTTENEPTTSVNISGAHVVYSVTFGILTWNIENLSHTYNALCTEGLDCEGVHYKLNSTGSDELMVQLAKLPLDDLEVFSVNNYVNNNSTNWEPLIASSDGRDLLLPRNFGTYPNVSTDPDDAYASAIINTVVNNHLYAEESLQMTYTAGIFYLFRDAVTHHYDSSTKTWDFVGNIKRLNIQASIPRVNAIISFVGVALVLVTAIGIAIVQKRGINTINHAVKYDVVAEAMFNKAKYPPVFLRMTLREAFEKASPAEREELLDKLKVQRIKFHRNDPKVETSLVSTLTVDSALDVSHAA